MSEDRRVRAGLRAGELDAADELARPARRGSLLDDARLPRRQLARRAARPGPGRVEDVVRRQWGELRIRSWDESGWWTGARADRRPDRPAGRRGARADRGRRLDERQRLQGPGGARYGSARPGRGRDEILVDATTFPTDGYIAESAARLTGRTLRPVTPADVPARARAAHGGRPAQPRRLPHRPAARPAGAHRRRARGGRARRLGPVPQRGRAAGRPGRARRRPRGRLHLQVPERRPGFARVPLRAPRAPGPLRLPAARLELARRALRDGARRTSPRRGRAAGAVGTPDILSMLALEAALDVWDGRVDRGGPRQVASP